MGEIVLSRWLSLLSSFYVQRMLTDCLFADKCGWGTVEGKNGECHFLIGFSIIFSLLHVAFMYYNCMHILLYHLWVFQRCLNSMCMPTQNVQYRTAALKHKQYQELGTLSEDSTWDGGDPPVAAQRTL